MARPVKTSQRTAAVMIPNMGDQQLVVPCVQRVLECTLLDSWQLVLVVNPRAELAPALPLLRQQVEQLVAAYNAAGAGDVDVELVWVQLPGPAGWTGAVNAGVEWLLGHGVPEYVVIMNDDVLVTPEWLARMIMATTPEQIVLQGEAGMHGNEAPGRDAAAWGRVGMVGPISNEVAGVQKVQPPEVRLINGAAFIADGAGFLDQWADDLHRDLGGQTMAASFLSGLCVLYTRECLGELVREHVPDCCGEPTPRLDAGTGCTDCVACGADLTPRPVLLDPRYGVGGYDDNDVAVRADRAGWRLAIARDVYVHHLGHRTLDVAFPEQQRGMRNVAEYLRAWEHVTDAEQRLVACYRVSWSTPWDLAMLGASLRRITTLCDGIALLATNSPAEVVSDPEWRAEGHRLGEPERQLVARAADAQGDTDRLRAALDLYLLAVVQEVSPEHEVEVAAEVWTGEWNERDERNAAISLAQQLRPSWCLSVDHDEVPEDRLTREHVQRLLHHPDPMITHYDVGWLNHWDTPRLCRTDEPWAHGYTASMRGFRLWRVTHPHHQRVLAGTANGLHCGNVPDAGESSKRVAGFRFRHYGYLRPQDRQRKQQRYMELDPQPDAVLTQAATRDTGGYDHLTREEGMQVSPYNPANGIGLTMLYHEGEQLYDLARHLDLGYGLVDRIVLVWTGPEGTGPTPDEQYVAERYGAEWVHHPLDYDLAAARNAGVDRLRELGCSWCWVMDPDEHLIPAFPSYVALRRMAEATDSWAWMLRFRNHRPDGRWNWSENTRMFRLEGGIMRFGNRVHETLERSLAELGRRGIHPQVRYAPFVVEHYGLAAGPKQTTAKLRRYTELLRRQIMDEPLDSPGAWVSLGLQYGNDGKLEEQWACYEWALRTSGHGYLPWREAAMYHLRKGRKLLEQSLVRLSPAHSLYEPTQQLLEQLTAQAPDQPMLGGEQAASRDCDLGELLAVAERAWAERMRPARKGSGKGARSMLGLLAMTAALAPQAALADDALDGEPDLGDPDAEV